MKEKGIPEWQYYKRLFKGVPGMWHLCENSQGRSYKNIYETTLAKTVSGELAACVRDFIKLCPADAWKISTSYKEKWMYAKFRMEDGSVHITKDGDPDDSTRKDGSQWYVDLKYEIWEKGYSDDMHYSCSVVIFQDGIIQDGGRYSPLAKGVRSFRHFLKQKLIDYRSYGDMNHSSYVTYQE